MHGFYRCLNLCVVLNFDISNIDYTSSLMYMIEISKVYTSSLMYIIESMPTEIKQH